jgi:hypothetical protein
LLVIGLALLLIAAFWHEPYWRHPECTQEDADLAVRKEHAL